jgi:hypothetical protein
MAKIKLTEALFYALAPSCLNNGAKNLSLQHCSPIVIIKMLASATPFLMAYILNMNKLIYFNCVRFMLPVFSDAICNIMAM